MAETTDADKKKVTVIVGVELHERIERVAQSRKRSVSGEAGMALETLYGDDPYLIDRLTGIALSQRLNPASLLKKLVDDYEYNRLSQERSQ